MQNNRIGLLIVDMQDGFPTATHKETIKEVIRQIKMSIQKHRPIFVLEYSKNGQTVDEIKDILNMYHNVYYLKKYMNDGGDKIIKCLKNNDINIDLFIVCGVNISYCVADTVHSLVKAYKKRVIVVKKACNCSENKNRAFENLSIYQNKKVRLF